MGEKFDDNTLRQAFISLEYVTAQQKKLLELQNINSLGMFTEMKFEKSVVVFGMVVQLRQSTFNFWKIFITLLGSASRADPFKKNYKYIFSSNCTFLNFCGF